MTNGRQATARSRSARSVTALTAYASPNARAVDLRTTLCVAHRVHSPNNNRPERNENCVTHVVGQKCYPCSRLLKVGSQDSARRVVPPSPTLPRKGGGSPPP